MSRSYRKNPIATDNSSPGTKRTKRCANKKVRSYYYKEDYLPKNGKLYKRIYESWDIHDWKIRYTWEDAKYEYNKPDSWIDKEKYPTLKSWYKHWKKIYKSK